MQLDDIIEIFELKMIQLQLTQGVVKRTTEKEITDLSKSLNQEISSNIPYYQSLKDGELKINSKRITTTGRERTHFLTIYKNKQYQWLLVEAYEEFKNFIENIYAYIGYNDNNLWVCSDFGKITLNELKKQDYAWFQKKSKKQNMQNTLNKLRQNFQKINNTKQNINLAIILIENLRHVIVHKNGVVDKKEDFVKKVLKRAGLHNINPTQENRNFIEQYFSVGKDKNLIRLLDCSQENSFITYNTLKILMNYLWLYSLSITKVIKEEGDKRGRL